MTRLPEPAHRTALGAEPAARSPRREESAWRIRLGWIAAALLHGAFLAMLICSWRAPVAPSPPHSAAVSLLLAADQHAAAQPAIRPKSPAEQIILPAKPQVKVANGNPGRSRPAAPARAAPVAPANNALAAPGGRVQTKTVPQQIGGGFIAARPVAGGGNQPPQYPALAQAHDEQGDVLLSVHVRADGTADSVSVTGSSGYEILDDAAAKAVWGWRFVPSSLSGKAVPSVIPYRIRFSLRGAD